MKKGLWNIGNGKDKKPSIRDGEAICIPRDYKALSIIALGLSDEYIHHIDGLDTSKEASNELEKIFDTQFSSLSLI